MLKQSLLIMELYSEGSVYDNLAIFAKIFGDCLKIGEVLCGNAGRCCGQIGLDAVGGLQNEEKELNSRLFYF